ncbi:hypothetical protein SLS62_000970 [Diatrype stigma]|uniref:Uncharacterized protein n=1 Tax=Diatrype stigma TaxID=117547 RepID=A0AAN9UWQ9_9PEZI
MAPLRSITTVSFAIPPLMQYASGRTLSFYALTTTTDPDASPNFSVDGTNAFTEDDTDSTSCVLALGEVRGRALLSSDGRAVMPPSSDDRGYYGPAKRWSKITECTGSFFHHAVDESPLGL